MIFTEVQKDGFYHYETEQFVGSFKFKSDKRITPVVLDATVLSLSSQESCKGETTYKGQVIHYEFEKKALWEDLNDEELKNN